MNNDENMRIESRPLWTTRGLLFVALALSGYGTSEPQETSIRALSNSQPQGFQRHIVTVEGVVKDVVLVPDSSIEEGNGCVAFMLQDKTGMVPIEVLEFCNHAVDGLPRDGEYIRVTGPVHVLDGDLPRRVRIQATKIETLKDQQS